MAITAVSTFLGASAGGVRASFFVAAGFFAVADLVVVDFAAGFFAVEEAGFFAVVEAVFFAGAFGAAATVATSSGAIFSSFYILYFFDFKFSVNLLNKRLDIRLSTRGHQSVKIIKIS